MRHPMLDNQPEFADLQCRALLPGLGSCQSASAAFCTSVSVVWCAGVLFVTIPALQVGGNAFTQTWQKGVNKSVGIK